MGIVKFDIPEWASKENCRSCGANIYWIKTKNGKYMPVNPDGISHFATCPNADKHRRKK